MKFLKRLAELRAANEKATESNKALLEAADINHETALIMREVSTEQARRLTGADTRNHYSESLTHAFRGRTA